MNEAIEKTLQKICRLAKCEAGCIIDSSVKGELSVSVCGKLDNNEKSLLAVIKLIIAKKEPSVTQIKQSKAFKSFIAEKQFKSFYKEKLFEKDDSHYYLLLFSKNKLPEARTLHQKIASLTDSLVNDDFVEAQKKTKLPQKNFEINSEIVPILLETINTINAVLYSTNAEGSEYNYITEAARTLFGFSPEEIYKDKIHVLRTIAPEHFGEFKEFIKKLRAGEDNVIEYRMKDRFGKEHWVRHSGVPIIKNNKIVRIVGVIQDITEEKKTQLHLERSEERFRLLIDTADDLLFVLDGFGYFGMVNKNGASALGYTPEEMIGKHFLDFVGKEDEAKIANAFGKILSTKGVTTFEANFLDRFDKEVAFEIRSNPMISEGEVSGMLGIGRNISGRKLDEQKIRDLNAKFIEANRIISIERERARHKITVLEELNKLKSEFISNVSHELRTPLASIVGFAETILSDTELPKETVLEFSQIILAEGKRLAKLINDLLDFSKLESGEDELSKEQLNLVELLDVVAKSFERQLSEKNLVLSKEYPPEKIIINADKERLTKVFGNLLSNATKFTNTGGRISILVQDFGKEVEIAITDTGIGIPEKDLTNLFQKFSKVQRVTTQIGGTGFGLVTVKQIVDLHKGFIKVRSEMNKGTTFIIRLPK
ncbi:MAG: PAS domain-containing sensor histidine kinase [Bacteroidetes bacterium]|nr:PAS domain-containing sensor histidine kinase [Bacteroidota bacterium]